MAGSRAPDTCDLASSAMWGCSLRHVRLQPPPPTVAASTTHGYSSRGTHRHVRGARCARHCLAQPLGVGGAGDAVHDDAGHVDVRIEGAVAVHHGRDRAGERPAVEHEEHRRAQPLGHLRAKERAQAQARDRARAPPRARARPALSSPRQSGRRGRHAAPCSPRSRRSPRHCRRLRRGRRRGNL